MKKRISIHWPLAIIVPLAAAAWLHAIGGETASHSRGPLAVDEATAELARTVSFGLVDGIAKPLPAASPAIALGASKSL